jgi:hypothetical protein
MNPWPFINAVYALAVVFLVGAAVLTYARRQRAVARLRAAETL